MKWYGIPCVAVMCFLIMGCSGYMRYDQSEFSDWPETFQDETNPIKIGKTVKIKTVDGAVVDGTVNSVSASGFVVDDRPVESSKVETAQVRSFLWVPTAVVGVSLVVAWAVFSTPASTVTPEGR